MFYETTSQSLHLNAGPVSCAVMVCSLLLTGQALAQGSNAPAPQNGSTCQAQQDPSNKTGRAEQRPVQDGQSLSGSLADCNSVLAPPAIGDKGLVEPAPHKGNMPVIKPGHVKPNTGSGG